jgi:TonB family protein
MRLVMILLAALAAPLAAQESDVSLVSIPQSAGVLVELNATVRYVSNGYFIKDCVVVVSSGDQLADKQACKTLSFKANSKPIETITSVWKKPTILGLYVAPLPRNKSTWLRVSDYPGTDQGTATMQLDIDPIGTLSNCKVIRSSGSKAIDKAAKMAICKRAKFYPASLDGQPVAAILLTTAKFYIGN